MGEPTLDLPADVVLKFGVPGGHVAGATMSAAYMAGKLAEYSEVITGPAKYNQHFLVADAPDVNARKLRAFLKGDLVKDGQNYIVAIRGAYDVALSGIIRRLESFGLSKPLEIIWTCCRSPINGHGLGKVNLEGGKITSDGMRRENVTPRAAAHATISDAVQGVLTVINAKDFKGPDGFNFAISGPRGKSYSDTEIFYSPLTTKPIKGKTVDDEREERMRVLTNEREKEWGQMFGI